MTKYLQLEPRDPKLEDLRQEFGLPEAQNVQGYWGVRLWSKEGKLKDEQWFPNLITTTGKNMLAGYFTGGVAGGFAINLAIGTGSTTPVVGDTTLTNEVGTRVSAGRAITANTAYYSGLFTAQNPAAQQSIIEYGNFSLNAVGYIFAHSTGAGVITKETTDTLEVQYRFAFP
jgi:hypothetical protein